MENNDSKDDVLDDGYMFASSSLSSPSTIVSKRSIQTNFKLIRTHALTTILLKNLLPGVGMHLVNIINIDLYPENYRVLVYRVELNLVVMVTHAMLFVSSRASPATYTIIDRVHTVSSLMNFAHIIWTWLSFRRRNLYMHTEIDSIVTLGLIALYLIVVVTIVATAIRERGAVRWEKM